MKIFVGGSLKNIEKNSEICTQFVTRLGELLMERGHILLNGCRGSLDKMIAESAAAWLEKNQKDPCKQIHSYILDGEEDKKIHDVGSVFISKLKDWSIEHVVTEVPEQINKANATIFIGGMNGTFAAATFARFAKKPILGIGMFGGSGRELNRSEKKAFEETYSYLLANPVSYDELNLFTKDVDRLADIVVSICEDLKRSSVVYSIMSFNKKYDDVFGIYKSTCERNGYKAERTDLDPNLSPISTRILDGIKQSDFVIADVSEMSPNVFYEIGYAQGLNRAVIITAETGTLLPFDIKDLPVIYYDRLNLNESLELKLEKYILNQKREVDI